MKRWCPSTPATRRALIGTGGIFDYIRAQLPGFRIEVTDHGDGAVSLFAVRGNPRRVFNVHLDTVPSSEAWSADPHVMRRFDDRVIGLGVCDIKGAAAGLIAAANVTDGDAAFLFSSDEEANDPRCIAAFLGSDHGFSEAIIAEPTRCEAVLAHRGISSVLMKFRGEAGHASGANAMTANALAPGDALGRQGAGPGRGRGERALRRPDRAALQHRQGRGRDQGQHDRAECGGALRLPPVAVAGHRCAARALRQLRCSRRPGALPGNLPRPSLPAGDVASAEERRLLARDLADELGLPIGNAVDFWTEASLFSQAGLTALVYGPGDIAQAHTADEFVTLEQLQRYAVTITRILGNQTT